MSDTVETRKVQVADAGDGRDLEGSSLRTPETVEIKKVHVAGCRSRRCCGCRRTLNEIYTRSPVSIPVSSDASGAATTEQRQLGEELKPLSIEEFLEIERRFGGGIILAVQLDFWGFLLVLTSAHRLKYRLYLKRISQQQANMVVAFGSSKDSSSYMGMSSLDGLGDYRSLSGSGRLPNAQLSLYSYSGMLGRLNSPTGVTQHSLLPQH
ncbi:hypothetical protein R6Q59_023008 [Mikania micrantha]